MCPTLESGNWDLRFAVRTKLLLTGVSLRGAIELSGVTKTIAEVHAAQYVSRF